VGKVLEVVCGDGFNAKHFYSHRSKEVIACDFDPTAIMTAQTKNPAANITYILVDIRTNMSDDCFGNIVWDAAIEHFTPEEIASIMQNIKRRLMPDRIISGYTLVERHHGKKQLHQHEYEFKDMHELKRFLTPHFKHVRVSETIYPSRHNLYFWTSDATIPLSDEWRHSAY